MAQRWAIDKSWMTTDIQQWDAFPWNFAEMTKTWDAVGKQLMSARIEEKVDKLVDEKLHNL